VPAEHAVGYTQLWVLPEKEGGAPGVEIGVASEEQEEIAYHLRVTLHDGSPLVLFDFALAPGETRIFKARPLVYPMTGPVKVTAELFRQTELALVYRRANGWVPLESPE
jgi:hypothetical protein